MRGARDGIVTACVNFDGDHVDIAISSRVIEMVGSGNLIGMTDRVENQRIAGVQLSPHPDNSLLYQGHRVVAAGTTRIADQVRNLRLAGVGAEDIWNMFVFTPRRMLKPPLSHYNSACPSAGFFVSPGTSPVAFSCVPGVGI
jgi:hypothetical protein